MESSNNILKELQELSPVLASSYPVPLPYTIPEGYFEQLASAILFIAKDNDLSADEELDQLSPLLKSISKTPPYHLPEGYFSELPENTVAETKAVAFVQEELDDFSPLLNPLKNAAVYEVPAGYFEQLPATILHKVRAEASTAKVVQLPLLKRIRKYAAAAAVALVLLSGGWWFLSSDSGSSTVSSTGIEKVSDDELVHFLEDQVIAPESNNNSVAATSIDASSVQDLFSEVSDEELQQYYDKNSSLIKVISN
ncbi:hypothetical protein HHL16_01215 [Pseudoflavitalea sp. G-6-1-2]|uniref:hypothetical protein n=1 Tax=Pseudoflavitalea sp. G-6-1-2 TaxID=2728841 RepID=UPI00146E1FE4|nr:hypothetical protein [Pseudoflavitalea sp. G-6-1-2]NML19467.1 hypothetical protein [Pseudoflavitalea sp. G-6-1-2]